MKKVKPRPNISARPSLNLSGEEVSTPESFSSTPALALFARVCAVAYEVIGGNASSASGVTHPVTVCLRLGLRKTLFSTTFFVSVASDCRRSPANATTSSLRRDVRLPNSNLKAHLAQQRQAL